MCIPQSPLQSYYLMWLHDSLLPTCITDLAIFVFVSYIYFGKLLLEKQVCEHLKFPFNLFIMFKLKLWP